MEIYRGRSMIDGSNIVSIATKTDNRKTGDVIQIWILPASMNPLEAIKNNVDRGVCGDCKHRGSTCYVPTFQAPLQIYRAWLKGNYPIGMIADNQIVRLGAYGDPCALPFNFVKEIAQKAKGYTGYTHQWKMPHVQPYKQFLMASVDSLKEYQQAKAMGWRTYRIKNAFENKLNQEIVCPASEEAGKKSTCEKCCLCSGLNGKGKKDIVINIHGLPYKQERFKRLSLNLV